MKTVLLIDDDLDDREIFQEALSSLGANTKYLEAKDGQEGLDIIQLENFTIPDLIFADLNMPLVNGLEFLIAARQIPKYHVVPIYIYSTSSTGVERNKCLQAGATDFIIKHSSFDDLCNELQKLIELNSAK